MLENHNVCLFLNRHVVYWEEMSVWGWGGIRQKEIRKKWLQIWTRYKLVKVKKKKKKKKLLISIPLRKIAFWQSREKKKKIYDTKIQIMITQRHELNRCGRCWLPSASHSAHARQSESQRPLKNNVLTNRYLSAMSLHFSRGYQDPDPS